MTTPRDTFGARLGMWLFPVSELLLFGGLFCSTPSTWPAIPPTSPPAASSSTPCSAPATPCC
ncbi:MAG: hypothetical protein R2864_05725 [Syntrophotaleaceae bacterium]